MANFFQVSMDTHVRWGSVLVAILVQQDCASASYLPLYQAPSVLGMQWTSSPWCCAIWLRLFCMWRSALPPCAWHSLEVWLQSLWGDWLCKELNCVCCGHKGHVSGDAQIQHCAYDCFDRRQWIVLLGGGNSSTASATLSVIKCVGNKVSMEICFLFVKFA